MKSLFNMLTIVVETYVRIRQERIAFHDKLRGSAQDPEKGQGRPVVWPAADVGPRQEGYKRCGQQQVKELS